MTNLLQGISADGRRLIATRSIRSLGDGFASIALAAYLSERGFSPFEVGLLVATALLGKSASTLLVGFVVDRIGRRRTLMAASLLVIASGVAFALAEPYWLLLVVAFIGTLSPSAGDFSLFQPVEQAALATTTPARRRTWLYARYSLFGSLAFALGSLLSGSAGLLAGFAGWELEATLRAMFALYGLVGIAMLATYRPLTPAIELATVAGRRRGRLRESRGTVLRLSGLFAFDAFGGGLVVQSLLAIWLFEHFGLSIEQAALVFFVAGVLSSVSLLLAAPLASRIGLVETMAYTHLPANLALMATPLMPTLPLALAMLFVRQALSQLDVPPRTTLIVSLVTPEERAPAASVTNVVRSLSAAASPALGGALLSLGPFGLPLLVGGALKVGYDVALLRTFRGVPLRDELRDEPSEETDALDEAAP